MMATKQAVATTRERQGGEPPLRDDLRRLCRAATLLLLVGLTTGMSLCAADAPPVVGSVTVSPSSVTGGDTATATVSLQGPAPAGGLILDLFSDHTVAVSVPGFVKFAPGQTRAIFQVSTAPVSGPETDHVRACLRGCAGTVGAITVLPAHRRTVLSARPHRRPAATEHDLR